MLPGSQAPGAAIGETTLPGTLQESFRESQNETVIDTEAGEWAWEPTWPERRSFQFPAWRNQSLLVAESSACTLEAPDLQQIETEARQMLERLKRDPGSYARRPQRPLARRTRDRHALRSVAPPQRSPPLVVLRYVKTENHASILAGTGSICARRTPRLVASRAADTAPISPPNARTTLPHGEQKPEVAMRATMNHL